MKNMTENKGFEGDIKIEGSKMIISIPLQKPLVSSGGRMVLIYSTKGFEEKQVNGVLIRVMLQIGWSMEKDELYDWRTDDVNWSKVEKKFGKLLGSSIKPRKTRKIMPLTHYMESR
jgi:hypothetical protein